MALPYTTLTDATRVPDHLIQRLPYKLVDRQVFRLDYDSSAQALDRFAEPINALIRSRVHREPNMFAYVDALLHIDVRWLLLHVVYQPGLPLSGWALMHEVEADEWACAVWPDEQGHSVPDPGVRIAARAAFDAAL